MVHPLFVLKAVAPKRAKVVARSPTGHREVELGPWVEGKIQKHTMDGMSVGTKNDNARDFKT